MNHSTQVGLATLALLGLIVWAWRKYGMLGGLAAAVVGTWLAGSYVPAIKSALAAGARLWETPSSVIQQLIN